MAGARITLMNNNGEGNACKRVEIKKVRSVTTPPQRYPWKTGSVQNPVTDMRSGIPARARKEMRKGEIAFGFLKN
jgi:hypothetical protein